MAGPGGTTATLQVHPTRRCNLRCGHCYTQSGPDVEETLPVELLTAAVADAAALGYGELAVSGGEPLLYPGLVDLLRAGREAGMLTVVTTNGMPLTARRAHELAPLVDVVAVSIDGTPEHHDTLRGHPGAHAATVRHLAHLRAAGIRFGIIATLTQHNVDQMAAVARLAADEGAALFQIHPLDQQGRAVEAMPEASPDLVELVAALVEGTCLRAGHPLEVQVDALLRDDLVAHPELFYATGVPGAGRLGDWLQTLVVEASGRVVPLTHGFPAALALGDLRGARLGQMATWWSANRAWWFSSLLRQAYDELTSPTAAPVVSWYEAVTAIAERVVGTTVAAAVAPPTRRSYVDLRAASTPFQRSGSLLYGV